jgi:hypothetical protein
VSSPAIAFHGTGAERRNVEGKFEWQTSGRKNQKEKLRQEESRRVEEQKRRIAAALWLKGCLKCGG